MVLEKALDVIKEIVAGVHLNPMIDQIDIKFLVRQSLTRLAAGPDGVSGTQDDVISPDALKDILRLLDTETLLDDVIDLVWKTTEKHRDEVEKVATPWLKKLCCFKQ
ncbi:MAG: hypothetical protein ACO35F_11495 [Ilumatobacteraceae bacterium]